MGEEGKNLICIHDERCSGNLKWFQFPQDLLSDGPQLAEGPSLTLDHVERQSSGIYRCVADNGVREPVSIDMQLTVLCKFKKIHDSFKFP